VTRVNFESSKIVTRLESRYQCFLVLSLVVSIFPHEPKAVVWLFCLWSKFIGWSGHMTMRHTKRQRVIVYSQG